MALREGDRQRAIDLLDRCAAWFERTGSIVCRLAAPLPGPGRRRRRRRGADAARQPTAGGQGFSNPTTAVITHVPGFPRALTLPGASMTRLTLPAADGSLPSNPVQWWYWTGHLATADGRRFGVEACFFVFTEETLLPQRVRDDLRGRRWWWQKLLGLAPRSPRIPDGALRPVRRQRTTATSTARCSSSACLPCRSNRYTLALDFPPGHRADGQRRRRSRPRDARRCRRGAST